MTPNVLSYTLALAGKGSVNRLMMVYDPANAAPDKRWVQGGIEMQMPDVIQLSVSPSSFDDLERHRRQATRRADRHGDLLDPDTDPTSSGCSSVP